VVVESWSNERIAWRRKQTENNASSLVKDNLEKLDSPSPVKVRGRRRLGKRKCSSIRKDSMNKWPTVHNSRWVTRALWILHWQERISTTNFIPNAIPMTFKPNLSFLQFLEIVNVSPLHDAHLSLYLPCLVYISTVHTSYTQTNISSFVFLDIITRLLDPEVIHPTHSLTILLF